ncbi:MAG TPA: chemotaxis protein CheD [Rhizobacter sp.]|nr:chemotaxis protein CheD [Rhizobacter sp.]
MAPDPQRKDVTLRPGDYAVGDAHCCMRTVLGSCVSITLWHPRRRIGAMSHFLLAARPASAGRELDARYGEDALALMLRDLATAGVPAQECEAKIFGGGNMFPEQDSPHAMHVGRRNGEAARGLLLARHIAVHSESLFGIGHRQIIFDVASGDVWARQIHPTPSNFTPMDHS